MKFIYLLFFWLTILKRVKLEDNLEPNLVQADEEDLAVKKGIDLVTNAFESLFYGEEVDSSYKDIFIDTSKPLLDYLEKGMDFQFKIPVDDMFKILVQTILILVANRRVDLISVDFNGKKSFFYILKH